jgi:hypothetical protein
MNTPVIGTGQTTVDNATLCSLADALEKMEFFALQDSYNAPVADAPGATLTVTMAGRTKKVTWNITAPPALTAFTATVDTLTVNSPTLRPIPAP